MRKNIYLYYAIEFLRAFSFLTPVWAFFFTSYLNFSLGWAIFLTVVSGVICLIFEIPTGALTDRFGRKKTYIFGSILQILSLSFYLFSESILAFLVSGILLGIGFAFCSGNLESMLHDSLEKGNKMQDFTHIQSGGMVSLFTGRAFGAALGGYSFVISPLLPVYLTILLTFLSFILVFFISNEDQILSDEKTNISHIKTGLQEFLKKKEVLHFILFLGIFSSLGNIYWYTYQPYMKSIGFSIENIGLLYAVISLFSALGSFTIKKLLDFFSRKQTLVGMYCILLLCSILFVYNSSIFGIIQILLMAFIFGFVMVLGNTYIIEHAPKTHKSTFLSAFSTTITIGYFFAGSIFGFLSDVLGLQKVYSLIPFLILGTLIVYYLTEKFLGQKLKR